MSQAGFDPPPADDTSYEADALLTKPPWLDQWHIGMSSTSYTRMVAVKGSTLGKGDNINCE